MKIVMADKVTCTECSHSFGDQYSKDASEHLIESSKSAELVEAFHHFLGSHIYHSIIQAISKRNSDAWRKNKSNFVPIIVWMWDERFLIEVMLYIEM